MFRIFAVVCVSGSVILLAWLFWPRTGVQGAPQSIQQPKSPVGFSKPPDQFSFSDKSAPPPAPETKKQAAIHDAGKNYEVPIGAILPAVLMDHEANGETQAPDDLLMSLEEEFFNEIEEAKSKGVAIHDIWEDLRFKYDEKYIALFGQDAYLEATSLAADEAREDYESSAVSN